MTTMLLLWNPTGEHMALEHDACILANEARFLYESDIRVRFAWDTGRRTTGIHGGERVVVLRAGQNIDPVERGVVRDGTVLGPIFRDEEHPHWKNFVPIEWGNAVPPEDLLPLAVLQRHIPNWPRPRTSGVILDDEDAETLERLWSRHLERYRRRLRLEVE